MYLVKTPRVIQKLFPNFHWKIAGAEAPVIYFTFDDGPIPQVTPWVLEQLAAYDAKATFFCVGNNARRYPELMTATLAAGHSVGNHTMRHLDGWKSENVPYFHDVRHCALQVKSSLFRPPYGRLKPSQAQFLQRHYEIVMWDVLSGDFDAELTPEDCFQNVVRNAESGSIVVFHDSLKAEDKLRDILPRLLAHYAALGYRFEALTPALLQRPAAVALPQLLTV
ncbi:polysaccharide deacetylase family protein [Neolewinella lacunae]|uniref:Polysaccharide deacetylase family protein n=1 Tax=Neolewinella lacunae TaxID=1517758 RepID=A0A923PMN4_9BACT|nr:polysaccharide deacetylase family protein [Neolewinella lacunae]MBC6996269.1 polysaccharide deacetylase family protein [Neolewinella lacunae]MDN3636892.1 polysaccharide deacetylase family protein [Neolewinella lacunae]